MKEIAKVKTDEADIDLMIYSGLIQARWDLHNYDMNFTFTIDKEEAAVPAKALINAIVEID